MEHDRPGRRIAQEVLELLGDVAVVDVEGRHPGLVGAEHGLQVLVAVVEVAGEVVLTGLVPGEPAAGDDGPESPVVERVGEAPGAVGHLGPGEAAIPEDQALPIGDPFGDRLVEGGEVQFDHRRPSWWMSDR